jgi:hypothetical protein
VLKPRSIAPLSFINFCMSMLVAIDILYSVGIQYTARWSLRSQFALTLDPECLPSARLLTIFAYSW